MSVAHDQEVVVRVMHESESSNWTMIIRWQRDAAVPFVKSYSFDAPDGMDPQKLQGIRKALEDEMGSWLF